MQLILASGSPRRRELLKRAGLRFRIAKAPIDESLGRETARAFVRRLSLAKARSYKLRDGELVLAADTVVVLGKRILGKPRSAGDARQMLRALSGRTHSVLTGYCLLARGRAPHRRVVATRVAFRRLTPTEITRYLKTGESMDKAGAYAAQGFGMLLLASIRGSYTNVIGLPMAEVLKDLSAFGIRPQ